MPDVSNDPFIPRPQARQEYLGGISGDTAARWQAEGKLPPLIRLSRKVVGWRKSTLEKFMAEQRELAS